MSKRQSKLLDRLAKAARSAFIESTDAELSQWIGTGPSIRARARLALAAAFLVAAPTLFVGVIRTTGVQEYARQAAEYSRFWYQTLAVQHAVDEIETSLWRFDAVKEAENQSALEAGKVKLERTVSALVSMRPKEFDKRPTEQIRASLLQLNEAIDRSVGERDMAIARLALQAIQRDLRGLTDRVSFISRGLEDESRRALSMVGRDQLILFLVMLFAIPVFMGFVPEWLVRPLVRLKRIEQRIEEGRVRELGVSGRDEVSQIARAIKSALMWREALDEKKTAKIFEVRNVLRAVITDVKEPVLIVARETKVNYANPAASKLLHVEAHHLEGTLLIDHVFAPGLVRAIEKAQAGDVPEGPIPIAIEFADGRELGIHAQLRAVYNREGAVSRVVVIFFA